MALEQDEPSVHSLDKSAISPVASSWVSCCRWLGKAVWLLRWPRSTFAFPVFSFYIRPHLCLAFPVRPHLCFAFPIYHSALIRASLCPFVLICASRFPFLIPPSFGPRVSRSSSFVLRVSHFPRIGFTLKYRIFSVLVSW